MQSTLITFYISQSLTKQNPRNRYHYYFLKKTLGIDTITISLTKLWLLLLFPSNKTLVTISFSLTKPQILLLFPVHQILQRESLQQFKGILLYTKNYTVPQAHPQHSHSSCSKPHTNKSIFCKFLSNQVSNEQSMDFFLAK